MDNFYVIHVCKQTNRPYKMDGPNTWSASLNYMVGEIKKRIKYTDQQILAMIGPNGFVEDGALNDNLYIVACD